MSRNISFLNSSMDSFNFTPMFPLERCFNRSTRTMTIGTIFSFYVLPVVSVIGIVGNILNLIVLNSKGMRTKTNYFLSAMAATDLAFFISMAFFNLATLDFLAESDTFMKIFTQTKVTFMALSNWFSAASIWIAVAVTVERLVAICRPLHARLFWQTHRIVFLLLCIYFFSFLLFVYQWFWMYPGSLPLCNGRRHYGLLEVKPKESPKTYQYVTASRYVAVICTFIIPITALMFLNSLLLHFLRQNRRDMLAKLAPAGDTGGSARDRSARPTNSQGLTNSHASIRHRTSENKVTFMVCVIVISFIVFLSPSAFTYIWEGIVIMALKFPRSRWLSDVALVSNHLVTVQKATNFVLYCSAGKHFRRKLLQLICKRLGIKRHYCDSMNPSRSLSKADNYTLNNVPGAEGAKLPSTNSIKHRSVDHSSPPPPSMTNKADGDDRFRLWRKWDCGYQRQTSLTPSPRILAQGEQRALIDEEGIQGQVMMNSAEAKELERLINKE